jgi:acyl carrier protein
MSEKLRDVFAEALGIDKSIVNDTLMYNEIEEWDSIAHMTLVVRLKINLILCLIQTIL